MSWEAGRYTKPRNLVLVLVVSVTLEMFYPLQMHSNTWKIGNPFLVPRLSHEKIEIICKVNLRIFRFIFGFIFGVVMGNQYLNAT